ncbi:hypothetical protein ACF0H5_016421 [Mactra antiquata]
MCQHLREHGSTLIGAKGQHWLGQDVNIGLNRGQHWLERSSQYSYLMQVIKTSVSSCLLLGPLSLGEVFVIGLCPCYFIQHNTVLFLHLFYKFLIQYFWYFI